MGTGQEEPGVAFIAILSLFLCENKPITGRFPTRRVPKNGVTIKALVKFSKTNIDDDNVHQVEQVLF